MSSFRMNYEKQMRITKEVVEQNAFDPSEFFFANEETARKQSDRPKGNESELSILCVLYLKSANE